MHYYRAPHPSNFLVPEICFACLPKFIYINKISGGPSHFKAVKKDLNY